MRAPAFALVWLLACTRADRAAPDCELVRKDPRTAAAKLGQKYPGAPVRVAETIERCIAPSGSPCERLAKVVAALPGLMPAGGPAVTAPEGVAEVCAGMPAEMQRCMMPSYALAHEAECAKVREQIARAAEGAAEAGSAAAPASAPCEELQLELARERITTHRGAEVEMIARPGGKTDADALRAHLEALASRCTGEARVTAAAELAYQDVIEVMDVAVAAGFRQIGFDVPESPAQEPAEPRPASTRDDLQRAPAIVVTRQAVLIGGKEIARISADVTEPVAAALAKARAADPELPPLAVLQADASTPVRTLQQVIGGCRRAGFDDVAFAIKNK